MNKNAIKNFAIQARLTLIDAVSQRAFAYEVSEKSVTPANADVIAGHPLSREEKEQRRQLVAQVEAKGFRQVMEEAAYTWFNRFIALRYMEVNEYLPTGIRVFTDAEGKFSPEILKEALTIELTSLNREQVITLLEKQDNEALYKLLLLAQCNDLGEILPGMFQRINNWTELLFPANLLKPGSILDRMVSDIPAEDWQDQVQIIGWLYQYYNTQKKDEVFEALKKNVKITKENIPAATQLFTPDWIVRYMVENSLGRLWVEGHPDVADQLLPSQEEQNHFRETHLELDEEQPKWHYYLPEAEQELEVQAKLAQIRKEYAALTPEEIKVIDPCMGSGHILAYMFDVLMQIYGTSGYSPRDAVASIVRNNIYGLDIDDRAAQLAYFSVMMKARQYDRRFLTRRIQPNVYAIQESNGIQQLTSCSCPECGYRMFPMPFERSDLLIKEIQRFLGKLRPVEIELGDIQGFRKPSTQDLVDDASPDKYIYQSEDTARFPDFQKIQRYVCGASKTEQFLANLTNSIEQIRKHIKTAYLQNYEVSISRLLDRATELDAVLKDALRELDITCMLPAIDLPNIKLQYSETPDEELLPLAEDLLESLTALKIKIGKFIKQNNIYGTLYQKKPKKGFKLDKECSNLTALKRCKTDLERILSKKYVVDIFSDGSEELAEMLHILWYCLEAILTIPVLIHKSVYEFADGTIVMDEQIGPELIQRFCARYAALDETI